MQLKLKIKTKIRYFCLNKKINDFFGHFNLEIVQDLELELGMEDVKKMMV